MAGELFPVSIGSFTAHGFALPERLPWGGSQRLGVHQLPGGVRIVDSMGASDADILWKGQLITSLGVDDAVQAAQSIDQMRKAGAPVTLAWDQFSYLVIIESFSPSYEFPTRVTFDLTAKVVADQAAPLQGQSQNNIDSLMQGDMGNTLNSAESLGMNVPSSSAQAFSTTSGAVSAGPTAITWTSQDFSQGVGSP
jgi:hypothetical protein